jgi:hypothetical protein
MAPGRGTRAGLASGWVASTDRVSRRPVTTRRNVPSTTTAKFAATKRTGARAAASGALPCVAKRSGRALSAVAPKAKPQ